MGEVVVSASGGGGRMAPDEDREVKAAATAMASVEDEIVVESEERVKQDASAGDGGGGGGGCVEGGTGLVKWDRFLPRVVLRVLLVEADDSTRQIIAALLRKCSYRVAAVPDGLKAWEILKRRPRNIDLILTEVDLPAISGYALLTLIMEHDICKNIPVIMMSTQDSISTVYKCMLRGAADYLVKPIRRNELKNLWQHVWRRHSSSANGLTRREDIVVLQKVEATAENNDASNHSSGYVACVERDKELIEKGSDAQSSCTKPDMETDFIEIEQKHDLSQAEWGKLGDYDTKKVVPEENTVSSQKVSSLQEGHATLDPVRYSQLVETEDVRPKLDKRDTTVDTEVCGDNEVTVNSYRKGSKLVGSLDNYPRGSYNDFATKVCMRQLDLPPDLDLSLKRSDLSGFAKHSIIEERQTLKHSDVSAFSRYVNKSSHTPRSGLASPSNKQKVCGSNPEKNNSQTANFNRSDAPGSGQSTPKSITSLATGQSSQSDFFLSSPNPRAFPAPVPVKGVRFDNAGTEFGSIYPQFFCAQSVPSIMPSQSSAGQKETTFSADSFHKPSNENRSFERLNNPLDHNISNSSNQGGYRQDVKYDSMEDQGHISPSTDRSEKSSLCNGTLTHHNSIDCGSICGSNSNVNQVPVMRSDGDSKIANDFVAQDGNVQRFIQREAALAKFRLKRKDRCYEKKVRYESRKKLAEQRPRVKGQFVRQMQTDSAPRGNDN